MRSTISDLWNGNIAPCEHCGAHDTQANQLICLLEQNRDDLCKELSDMQKEIFQKYIDCSEEYLLRMMELAFCDGFCLGNQLAIESLE